MKQAIFNSLINDNIEVLQAIICAFSDKVVEFSYNRENDLNHTDLSITLNLGNRNIIFNIDVKKPSVQNRNSINFTIGNYDDSVYEEPNSYFAFIDTSNQWKGYIYIVSKKFIKEKIDEGVCRKVNNYILVPKWLLAQTDFTGKWPNLVFNAPLLNNNVQI